jgi:transposase-like protein
MPAVTCPRCGSKDTYRIEEAGRGGTPRWECGDCRKSFVYLNRPNPDRRDPPPATLLTGRTFQSWALMRADCW